MTKIQDAIQDLTNNTILYLDLANQNLDDKKIQPIIKALEKNASLRSLDLSNNALDNSCLHHLTPILSKHPALTSLNLSSNAIGEEGARTLLTAFTTNTLLQNLNLDMQKREIGTIEETTSRALLWHLRYNAKKDSPSEPRTLEDEKIAQKVLEIKQHTFGTTNVAMRAAHFLLDALPSCYNRHIQEDGSLPFDLPFDVVFHIANVLSDPMMAHKEGTLKLTYLKTLLSYLDYGITHMQNSFEPITFYKDTVQNLRIKLTALEKVLPTEKEDPRFTYLLAGIRRALNVLQTDENLFITFLTILPLAVKLQFGPLQEQLSSLYGKLGKSDYLLALLLKQLGYIAIEGDIDQLIKMEVIYKEGKNEFVSASYIDTLGEIIKNAPNATSQQIAYNRLRTFLTEETFKSNTPLLISKGAALLAELKYHPSSTISTRAKEFIDEILKGSFPQETKITLNRFHKDPSSSYWIKWKEKYLIEEKQAATTSSADEIPLEIFSGGSLQHETHYIPRNEEEPLIDALKISNAFIAITSLTGAGGIGKTQLAKHLFFHPPKDYTFRAWFEAENLEELTDQYRDLGKKLNLVNDQTSSEDVLKTVLPWLSNQKNSLLFYDNATNYQNLEPYLPKAGTVLVTSREMKWPGTTIPVDIMTPSQAKELITSIIQREDPLIPTLAKEMGYLPLALAQSASHIQDLCLPIQDYLNLFYDRREKYLQEEILPQGDKHLSVWTTAKLAYENLLPQAAELLTACALLAPENIPSTLLEKLFSDKETYLKMRALLINRSLIKIDIETQTLSIHRLTQTILEKITPNKKEILEKIVTAFNDLYPFEKPTMAHYALARELVPHAEALLSHVESEKQQKFLFTKLLENLANAAQDLGEYAKAKELFTQALAINQRAYGPDHVHVARTLEHLGNAERNLGHYAEAKELLAQALRVNQREYGPDHVNVAMTLQNLGNAESDLGHFAEAKELYKQVLAINQREYGPDHVNVARTLENLGTAERNLGHYAEAKELYKQALAIKQKEYGADHVIVARTLENLGTAERDLGHYAEAKELYKQALAINQREYGPDHVIVASTLHNLGNAESDLGHFAEAKELYTQALAIKQREYGPDHVHVAMTLENLGTAERNLGHYAEAKELLTQALAINQREYGPDHVHVAMTLENLGNAERNLGHFAETKELLTQALAIKKREYGPDHVNVAMTLENLGNAERNLGHFAETKELYSQALAIKKREYGPDHVHVARTLFNMALVEEELNEKQKAQELYKEAYPIFRKFYGDSHSLTKNVEAKLRNSN